MTQTDQTANRAFGNVYQNTGSTPMFVDVSLTAGTTNVTTITTDASNPPTTVVAEFRQGLSVNAPSLQGFLVLPGNFYKVAVSVSATLLAWIEWA